MKLFVTLVHIDPLKSAYLAQVLESLSSAPFEVKLSIITNITDVEIIRGIRAVAPNDSTRFTLEIVNRGYDSLPSPWLLAWVHKVLMFEKFQDASFTHFLNIEDDMLITPENILYWCRARENLRQFGLIPSFLRLEFNSSSRNWVSVDFLSEDKFNISQLPKIFTDKYYGYISLPRFYQGMFMYDRQLMEEYMNSGRYYLNEAFPEWRLAIQSENFYSGIGEASHEALSRIKVPEGFFSRNVIPTYFQLSMIDPCCFVHHLPNKYVNLPNTNHGKRIIWDLLYNS
jgi:hypothetical protein